MEFFFGIFIEGLGAFYRRSWVFLKRFFGVLEVSR